MNKPRPEYSIGMRISSQNGCSMGIGAMGTITERGYFNSNGDECFKIKWDKDPEGEYNWFHYDYLKIIKPQSLKDLLE